MNGRHGRHRTALSALAGLVTLGALLSGCGIRATEVPTDFGPAPSRVRCSLGEPEGAGQGERGLPVQVFLVCGPSLVAVDRAVRVADGAADARRVLVAQGLMDELTREPTTPEREAGYTTRVRPGTTVTGPRAATRRTRCGCPRRPPSCRRRRSRRSSAPSPTRRPPRATAR